MQRPVTGRTGAARTSARTTRIGVQIPRIARELVEARQPRRQHAEIGHGRLGEQHAASLAGARSRRGIGDGRLQRQCRAAKRNGGPFRRDIFLDRQRHPVDGPSRLTLRPARFRGLCRNPRRIRIVSPECIELRLIGFNAADDGFRNLDGRKRLRLIGGHEFNG